MPKTFGGKVGTSVGTSAVGTSSVGTSEVDTSEVGTSEVGTSDDNTTVGASVDAKHTIYSYFVCKPA